MFQTYAIKFMIWVFGLICGYAWAYYHLMEAI